MTKETIHPLAMTYSLIGDTDLNDQNPNATGVLIAKVLTRLEYTIERYDSENSITLGPKTKELLSKIRLAAKEIANTVSRFRVDDIYWQMNGRRFLQLLEEGSVFSDMVIFDNTAHDRSEWHFLGGATMDHRKVAGFLLGKISNKDRIRIDPDTVKEMKGYFVKTFEAKGVQAPKERFSSWEVGVPVLIDEGIASAGIAVGNGIPGIT